MIGHGGGAAPPERRAAAPQGRDPSTEGILQRTKFGCEIKAGGAGWEELPLVIIRPQPLLSGRELVVIDIGAGIAGISLGLLSTPGAPDVSAVHVIEMDNRFNLFYENLQELWSTVLGRTAPAVHANTLPADATKFSAAFLDNLNVPANAAVLVVGGTSCQARSTAGRGDGIFDARSAMFPSALRILKACQDRYGADRVHYLFENVPVARDDEREGVRRDYERYHDTLGEAFVFDAADVGSYAHRRRAYWTNMFSEFDLCRFIASFVRVPSLADRPLHHLLEPERHLVLCNRPGDASYRYPNMVGSPPVLWPTLMSTVGSFQFRLDANGFPNPGMVEQCYSDGRSCTLDEPTPAEREAAMGFPPGYTALLGSRTIRHHATGQTVDQFAMRAVFGAALAARSATSPELVSPATLLPPSAQPPNYSETVVENQARPAASGSAPVEAAPLPSSLPARPLHPWWKPASAIGAVLAAACTTASDDAIRWIDAAAAASATGADSFLSSALDLARASANPCQSGSEPLPAAAVPPSAPAAPPPPGPGGALIAAILAAPLPTPTPVCLVRGIPQPPSAAAASARAADAAPSSILEQLDTPLIPLAGEGGRLQWTRDSFKLSPKLSPDQDKRLRDLLWSYHLRGVFAYDLTELGRFNVGEPMRIQTDPGAVPQFQRQRRMSPDDTAAAVKELTQLLEHGLVEASVSAWCANILMVGKKDGTRRLCVDNRPLNRVTVPWRYPMGSAREIFDKVASRQSKIFSVCDLYKGFWQVPLHPEDRHKTAFSSPLGQLQWTVSNFGLKGAPAGFFEKMDRMCRPLEATEPYVDDTLTNSPDFEQHLLDLAQFFDACLASNVRINPSKCVFGYEEVQFVGMMVNGQGVKPAEDGLRAVREAPRPTSVADVQSFLGIANYLRDYVADFSLTVKPLTVLLQKNQQWQWEAEQETAFQDIKTRLCSAPLLRHLVPGRRITVATDWCIDGIGAVLSQMDEAGQEYVCAYLSKTNNAAERNYHPYKGELMAVIWAIGKWQHLVGLEEFDLVTDHQALIWLFETKDLQPMLARWVLRLDEFNIHVKHRPGQDNRGPDYLSRNSLPELSASQVLAVLAAFDIEALAAETGQSRPGSPDWSLESSPAPRDPVLIASTAIAPILRIVGAYATDEPATWLPGAVLVVGVDPTINIHRAQDPWNDPLLLDLLRFGDDALIGASRLERDRVQHRARSYRLELGGAEGERLLRCYPGGAAFIVTPPGGRQGVIRAAHAGRGGLVHSGTSRTYDALKTTFWWPGMYAEVAAVVRDCPACDRANAARMLKQPRLQPLPIKDLFYRLSIDLAGPFPVSIHDNTYVLVMCEHLSRGIFLAALPSKAARHVAYELRKFFGLVGGVGELLSDNGSEFKAEVSALLERWLVDHRWTSPNHPQTNGLTERAVGTVKSLLRTAILAASSGADGPVDWDELLPEIQMAYNCSPQSSTGLAPYTLIFGRNPGLPAFARVAVSELIDFTDPAAAVASLQRRQEILRRAVPFAMDHLAIAQHRDEQRFARTRQGGYTAAILKAEVGHLVYIKDHGQRSLDPTVKERILQVVEVKSSGLLVLQGRDGLTITVHPTNVAPCKRADVDTTVTPTFGEENYHRPCEHCSVVHSTAANPMLLCDLCNSGWHMDCLQVCQPVPPSRVPPASVNWYCKRCVEIPRLPPGTVMPSGESRAPFRNVGTAPPALRSPARRFAPTSAARLEPQQATAAGGETRSASGPPVRSVQLAVPWPDPDNPQWSTWSLRDLFR